MNKILTWFRLLLEANDQGPSLKKVMGIGTVLYYLGISKGLIDKDNLFDMGLLLLGFAGLCLGLGTLQSLQRDRKIQPPAEVTVENVEVVKNVENVNYPKDATVV